jgi:uncharacterized protein
MNLADSWFPGHLTELSVAECLEQLGAHQVGRVAYCDPDGPVVVPVNYVLEDESVLIQLAPGSALARSLDSTPASFQLDEFDEFTQSGWSVLVRGTASYVEPGDHPATSQLQPWAEGQRTRYVRIAATVITGRRLLEA